MEATDSDFRADQSRADDKQYHIKGRSMVRLSLLALGGLGACFWGRLWGDLGIHSCCVTLKSVCYAAVALLVH